MPITTPCPPRGGCVCLEGKGWGTIAASSGRDYACFECTYMDERAPFVWKQRQIAWTLQLNSGRGAVSETRVRQGWGVMKLGFDSSTVRDEALGPGPLSASPISSPVIQGFGLWRGNLCGRSVRSVTWHCFVWEEKLKEAEYLVSGSGWDRQNNDATEPRSKSNSIDNSWSTVIHRLLVFLIFPSYMEKQTINPCLPHVSRSLVRR